MLDYLLGEEFLKIFFHCLIYISGGALVYYIIKFFMLKALKIKLKSSRVNPKREKTINILLTNIIKYIVLFIILVLVLKEFGINTTSLLASLGVAGLVVGFALQDTIKDFVSGIFIITDREYEVGDYVTIDNFTGEVIALGLKTTKIRAYTGEVKMINNSGITTVINYSQYNSNLLLDINVAYEEDANKVLKILEKLGKKIKEYPEVKNVDVLGVNSLDDSSVQYRVFVETKPYQYFAVRRDALKMIKEEFEKNNIKIPYPQVEVHDGKKI